MSDVEVYELRGRIALSNAAKDTAHVSRRHLQEALVCAQRLGGSACASGHAYSLLLRAGVANLLGQKKNSIKHLCDAIDAFEAVGNSLYASVASRRLAELLGDSARVREADQRLRDHCVRDPEAMTVMLAPGWGVSAPGEQLSKQLGFGESGVRLAREQSSQPADRGVVNVPVRRDHAV